MRYEDWDVLLFSKDSHVPIQEFKTACYVAQDEFGRQLPTLTSYITSLPAALTFRISIHSWTKPKPTELIESQKQAYQRVVFPVCVIIDGVRVFQNFYELNAKWPREIENEQSSSSLFRRPTSERKSGLQFPPFRQDVLMQSSWSVREHVGRIKILLSEALLGSGSSLGDAELQAVNHLVCFSFQHAPRDILEQAGIAWPIRNPLYLPSLPSMPPPTGSITTHTTTTKSSKEPRERPRSPTKRGLFQSWYNPTLFDEPDEAFGSLSRFSQPPAGQAPTKDRVLGDTQGAFFEDVDDTSMLDTWSTHRTSSQATTDISMSDYKASRTESLAPSSKMRRRMNVNEKYNKSNTSNESTHASTRAYQEKPVVMTLRDDQFEALIGALSPPKCYIELSKKHEHLAPQQRGELSGISLPAFQNRSRPSAAALARNASYPDICARLQNVSKKASPTHPNGKRGSKPPSTRETSFASGKENMIPTPRIVDGRASTPQPVGKLYPQYSSWQSDVEMKDPSSVHTSLSRANRSTMQSASGKNSPAPALAVEADGGIKSRKEGKIGGGSPASLHYAVRHDQSLLPQIDSAGLPPSMPPPMRENKTSSSVSDSGGKASGTSHSHTSTQDTYINAPAYFAPTHRGQTPSVNRLEKQLYSALGDFLSDSQTQSQVNQPLHIEVDTGSWGHAASSVRMRGGDVEKEKDQYNCGSPVIKRKRQGTIGGERDAKHLMEGGGSKDESEEGEFAEGDRALEID